MNHSTTDSFFEELKRRKVVKVALAYVGVAMAALEVADIASLFLDDRLKRTMVIGAAAGLPVVLVLAWLFDLTSKGVELTPTAVPESAPGVDGLSARFARQLVVTGAIVIVAMTGVGWRYMPTDRVDYVANRVVVSSFTNNTGDAGLDFHGDVVANEINRNLGRIEGLEVVPRGESGPRTGPPDADGRPLLPPSTQALADQSQAGLVITGSYRLAGEELEFLVEVHDGANQVEIFAADAVRADPADPSLSYAQLQETLFGFLAGLAGETSPQEIAAVLQTRPPTYAAQKEYALGIELVLTRPFQREAQLARLDSAVSLDSTFVAALIASASVHIRGGDRVGAQPNLDRLETMRTELTRFERASLDLVQARAARDVQGVYRASGTAAELVGTSWSHYFAAEAAMGVNRPKEAIDHLLEFDRKQIRHPSPWQILAAASHRLGRHRRELRLTRQMRKEYLGDNWVFLRLPELRALAARGKGALVLEVFDSFDLAGAPAGVVLQAATEVGVHGDPERARMLRERLLERERARPAEERQSGRGAGNWGVLLASLDRNEEAGAVFRALVETNPNDTRSRVDAAIAAVGTGDRDYAEQAIDWLDARMGPSQRGGSTFDQAKIAAALGDADRTVRLLQQAEGYGTTNFGVLHVDPAFGPIRDHPAFVAYMKPRG